MLVTPRGQRVNVQCFLSNIFQSLCGIKKNKKQSMAACAYCCIVEEYSSKKILVKHAEGLMNISYQWENGNKRRTWLEQFVHWAVDRPGTGQEINRISTCIKYESNVFWYITSPLCTLSVPSAMDRVEMRQKRQYKYLTIFHHV